MRTISTNAVRGRSYEKIFTRKFDTKVSLHENFQIYGMLFNYAGILYCGGCSPALPLSVCILLDAMRGDHALPHVGDRL